MYLTFGNLISATGAAVRAFKWWRVRREEAERVRRRREFIAGLLMTAGAIAAAIVGMVWLAKTS